MKNRILLAVMLLVLPKIVMATDIYAPSSVRPNQFYSISLSDWYNESQWYVYSSTDGAWSGNWVGSWSGSGNSISFSDSCAASNQVVTYSYVVYQFDNGNYYSTEEGSFEVSVTGLGSQPVTQSVTCSNVALGQAVTFLGRATDADGDLHLISFHVSGPTMPGWNLIENVVVSGGDATASLTWTPPAPGTWSVHIRAGDYAGNADSNGNVVNTFNVTTIPPITKSVTCSDVPSGRTVTFLGRATDADGDLHLIGFYVSGPTAPGWNFIGNVVVSGGDATASLTWTPPAPGTWSVHIRAGDYTGNPDSNGNIVNTFNVRPPDIVMWYDVFSTSISTPWPDIAPVFPVEPADRDIEPVNPGGAFDPHHWYTSLTPLLGNYNLYSQGGNVPASAAIIRQHAYWLKSLGVDAIIVDWTNVRSEAESPGHPWYPAVRDATEAIFRTFSQITEFTPPKIIISVRRSNSDASGTIAWSDSTANAHLGELVDEVKGYYDRYPSLAYHLPGSSKPLVHVFVDFSLGSAWRNGPQWSRGDLDFRFTDGYLIQHGLTTQMEGAKNSNLKRFADNSWPYWNFVENTEVSGHPGHYHPLYRKTEDGTLEQTSIWVAVHRGGMRWDGMIEPTFEGKHTIDRMVDEVINDLPAIIVVNRFNYPILWWDQPQEGVTMNRSTMIEPALQWNNPFLVFDIAASAIARLKWTPLARPGKPTVQQVGNNTFKLIVQDFPTHFRIRPTSGTWGSWNWFNWSSPNFEAPAGSFEVQTRVLISEQSNEDLVSEAVTYYR